MQACIFVWKYIYAMQILLALNDIQFEKWIIRPNAAFVKHFKMYLYIKCFYLLTYMYLDKPFVQFGRFFQCFPQIKADYIKFDLAEGIQIIPHRRLYTYSKQRWLKWRLCSWPAFCLLHVYVNNKGACPPRPRKIKPHNWIWEHR